MNFAGKLGFVKLALLIGVASAFLACRAAPKEAAPGGPPVSAGPIVRIVYLYNSEACQCERDRNEVAEGAMANVMTVNPSARRVEKIDVSRQPAELERYEKLTRFGFMPVLLGLDANGRVVRKEEGFFKEAAVAELLTGQ